MEKRKLEIYIHIPFCKKKCNYCDFLSFQAEEDLQNRYCDALMMEMDSFFQSDAYWKENYEITSVFIGGGTPSVVDADRIAEILSHIPQKAAEITLEANPGTLDKEKLFRYRQAGINRLSLGVQSTDNKMLPLLGRIHTWEQFLENYEQARLAGFENINLDLMSGLPGQTVNDWEETLLRITKLSPEHISAYSLILEEGTPFFKQYEKQPELLPTEEETASMYELTGDILSQKGYRQYEISNYAKDGYACHHNLGYWYRTEYIGFGIGAASLLKETRYKNTEQIQTYLSVLTSMQEKCLDKIRVEQEYLSVREQMEETMFLGLRCNQGVSDTEFLKKFGKSLTDIYGNVIAKYLKLGFLTWREQRLCLTKKAFLVSNEIFQDFLTL